MMDWLSDFIAKFQDYPEIQDLKSKKIHGKLEINFTDGMPINYNLNTHRRAKAQP